MCAPCVCRVFRSVYELHVENLAADPALVDGELLSSPSLSSSSARRLRFDLSSSLSFRCTNSRAIGLAEDEAVKSQSSALLDVCFHWSSQWVNRVQCQYAFMLLDLDVSTHGRQADNLRPLDIAYAARLCCYENQTTRPQHGSHNHVSQQPRTHCTHSPEQCQHTTPQASKRRCAGILLVHAREV